MRSLRLRLMHCLVWSFDHVGRASTEISVICAVGGVRDVDHREQSGRTRLILDLPAGDASGVSRARWAVTRHAELLGLDEDIRERVRLAVTEACTNCVRHAYDGSAPVSSYRLEACRDGCDLVVVVQDWGAGMAGDGDTPSASKNPGLGFGLKMIRELASTVEVATALNQGTRLEMRFAPGRIRM
jgi:anti-sigma regulatory factor (Ser/Thr protein kinase)